MNGPKLLRVLATLGTAILAGSLSVNPTYWVVGLALCAVAGWIAQPLARNYT